MCIGLLIFVREKDLDRNDWPKKDWPLDQIRNNNYFIKVISKNSLKLKVYIITIKINMNNGNITLNFQNNHLRYGNVTINSINSFDKLGIAISHWDKQNYNLQISNVNISCSDNAELDFCNNVWIFKSPIQKYIGGINISIVGISSGTDLCEFILELNKNNVNQIKDLVKSL